MDEVEHDIAGFIPILGVAEVAGFMVVVLMGVWTGHFLGGFSWQSDPKHQFNWHPLLMSISLIFLYGNGILIYRGMNQLLLKFAPKRRHLEGALIYRLFRSEKKKKLKLLHAATMFTVLIITVIALKAVFDSHNLNMKDGVLTPIPNLYSLHSWMGITTVILFAFQWLAGLITFLFPGLASHLRAAFMPVHVFSGILIFVLACTTALLGITEKTIWTYKDYADRVPGSVVANWIGILILVFGILVVYLVTNAKYKRLPRPEDGMLLNEANQD